MRTLAYEFSTGLEFSAPVGEHVFTLRCLPVEDETQTVLRAVPVVQPPCTLARLRDGFGGAMLCGSLTAPHGSFLYRSEGVVRVDLAARRGAAPDDARLTPLRWPGTLTAPSGAMRAFFNSLPMEGQSHRRRCEILSAAVNGHFRYAPGVTGISTTAAEAFAAGAGVCQDYAQVFAALARLAGYPARYCMGLAVGEGVTHAWAEAFLPGEGWRGYDPTRGCEAGEGYLRFGMGRDAADCPVERGVFRGNADQTQTVFMRCWETQSEDLRTGFQR